MTFLSNIVQFLSEWGPNLLWGLVATLQIALGGYALGLLIGLGGALGKIYGGPVTRLFLEIYTTLIRAVPELVLILLLYYAGTQLLNDTLRGLGYERVDISGVAAGVAVLGIVQGAYATEVLRGAMQAIPRGQVEAAQAYGMSAALTFRRIMLPAMVPLALPGMANLWLIITKDTALLAVVGFEELAGATRQAAGSTRLYLEAFVVAGGLYLGLTLASNRFFKWLEGRATLGQVKVGAA
ncbi:MAG: ABC transporter permease subunit [Pseudomonadota bacterium]